MSHQSNRRRSILGLFGFVASNIMLFSNSNNNMMNVPTAHALSMPTTPITTKNNNNNIPSNFDSNAATTTNNASNNKKVTHVAYKTIPLPLTGFGINAPVAMWYPVDEESCFSRQ